MVNEAKTGSSNAAIIVALWSAVLLTIFIAFRSNDLFKLPSLLGNLGGGPLFGTGGIIEALIGILAAVLILVSWLGLGTIVVRFLPGDVVESFVWFRIARNAAIGSIIWSLVWFVLGLIAFYSTLAAAMITIIGLVCASVSFSSLRSEKDNEHGSGFDGVVVALIAFVLLLTAVASLAPPTAKDSLLYHFSLPKAFIAQGSNAFVDGNIASYLALGTEMHAVWAMLLGNLFSARAGEAAAGAVVFLFFPLLLLTVYGWARKSGVSRIFSLIATLMVASIPTAFHVASSGYIDIALALYVTLAVYSLIRWWKTLDRSSIVFVAIFLGGALAVKLTSVFVIAAFALIVLLRARGNPVSAAPGSDDPDSGTVEILNPGKIVGIGFGALLLAGVIASPWYLRNWAATGSPVFPFYLSIWKGTANGWDVERSSLFQMMNSQYGGADINKANYLMAPLRISLAAQPENPELYDGVLGVAFLIGAPLLVWTFWKKKLTDEFVIATGVAVIVYLFWLFSSPQLRYLLPIAPLLAIAIVGAIESGFDDSRAMAAAKYSLIAASFTAILTSVAWFCQKAPLRVVLGGETRDQYMARNLDYYSYYREINKNTATDAKVWLINMRRDTYNLDRPVFSDYLFEDWTLRKMLWESRNVEELRAKAAAIPVQYVLVRHDFLFDYDRSTLVDDKRPRAENESKLKIAKAFLLEPARTIMADDKFCLIRVF